MIGVSRHLLFASILLASPAIGLNTAWAHHPGIGGAGGAGPIDTIGADTLDQGQFAVSAFIEYVRLHQLGNATLLANIGNDVHGLSSIDTRTLALAYGITNDFMVTARLPWVRRTGILEGEQGDPEEPPSIHDRGSTSGFGDVTVLGQYRFLNNQGSGTQVAGLFGFKAPTGRTGLIDPFGEVFEAEFQPGSGSWDGLLGAAFSQRLDTRWTFHANMLGVVAGTGTQDTNLGNRLLYNAAVVYRIFGETANEPHSHDAHAGYAHEEPHPRMVTKAPPPARPHSHIALDGVLELNGEWHDKQRTAGVIDPNSGGNTIYLSPGLRLTVENWSGYVSAGFPLVKDLNGIQPAPAWRMIGGVSVVFAPLMWKSQ
jgi:Putative MetA-pathway of phenol degradation